MLKTIYYYFTGHCYNSAAATVQPVINASVSSIWKSPLIWWGLVMAHPIIIRVLYL